MEVPMNYNSNFHQHRRDFAVAKKAAFAGGGKGGRGRRGSGAAP